MPRPAMPPNIPIRRTIAGIPPGSNLNRIAQRDTRRQGARTLRKAAQIASPRPVVRPASAPLKIMPKTPAPPQAQLKSMRRGQLPAAPARPASAPRAQAAAAAGVAAVAGLIALNASRAHEDISPDVSALQSSLQDLERRSQFPGIFNDLESLDGTLDQVVELLESARGRGYHYQPDMEEIAYHAAGGWEAARPQVFAQTQAQAAAVSQRLSGLNPNVQRLNASLGNPAAAAGLIRSTQSAVNAMLAEIERAESELERQYREIESDLLELNGRLRNIHWALEQLGEAKFDLNSGEHLVMAVKARWDKEGKDDPEGVLYLTNRRLVFERKEKVATKKILFITTASELVQEILIDQPAAEIKTVRSDNKGLFGHQDYIFIGFADGDLGEVPIHINGQDSEKWSEWIEQVRSGRIDSERAGEGAGISLKDLTRPISAGDVLALQSEVNSLQDEIMLSSARAELSDLENEVRTLERDLGDVRAKGYSIESDLEAEVTILAAQWDRIKSNAEKMIDTQSGLLGAQMEDIRSRLARVMGMTDQLQAAQPLYMQLKSTIASANAQAEAALDSVVAQYDQYADEVESLHAHLAWVDWMLSALATASFSLRATENGVAATEAVFLHPGWEPENGILFLSDQRLIWEDRVETYEVKFEAPVQEILEVKTNLEGGVDHIQFKLGANSPTATAKFRLSLPVGEEWLTMVGRARTGGYAQDQVSRLSEEELERIRSAPQSCSNCGAAYTAPILRGQIELVCEYCGVVTRF